LEFEIMKLITKSISLFIFSAIGFSATGTFAQSSETPSTEAPSFLLDAVFNDDVKEVKRRILNGADVNQCNMYEVSALSLACEYGHATVAVHLINADAEVEAERLGGETPLMLAARNGNVEVVKALLAAEVEVDHRDKKGQTALMWAAAAGNVEVVDALIEAGADVDYHLDWAGFTAFHFAAREGRIDVVKRFLEGGFDVNAVMPNKSKGGRNPRQNMSALLLAVESAHFELAIELIDAGADPNDQRSGYAPLHAVSWVRRTKLGDNPLGDPAPRGSGGVTSLQFVNEVIERGGDVNLQLKNGRPRGKADLNSKHATPFLLAAQTADLPLMKLLLERGADPKIKNRDGCTALIAAAGIGSVAVGEEPASEAEVCAAIELLVDLGLDVNAVDDNLETPMHGAAYRAYPKAIELLTARGADPAKWNHKNKFNWSPLDIGHGKRPGSVKPSPPTIEALEKALNAVSAK
jgi:ankyrin repeat protein